MGACCLQKQIKNSDSVLIANLDNNIIPNVNPNPNPNNILNAGINQNQNLNQNQNQNQIVSNNRVAVQNNQLNSMNLSVANENNQVISENRSVPEKKENEISNNKRIALELIKKSEQEYPDMPEWEGNRFSGMGIKKMKGYKCELPIDELNKKREEFWKNQIKINIIWKIIKQACLLDFLRSEILLDQVGLKCTNGCMKLLIDKHENMYRIPNYCINDPFFEKKILPKREIVTKKEEHKIEPSNNDNNNFKNMLKSTENEPISDQNNKEKMTENNQFESSDNESISDKIEVSEKKLLIDEKSINKIEIIEDPNEGNIQEMNTIQIKKLKINIFDLYANKKEIIKVPDSWTGKDLKENFRIKNRIDIPEVDEKGQKWIFKIRALYGGSEIQDDHCLYQHNIKNGHTIQIMKQKIQL